MKCQFKILAYHRFILFYFIFQQQRISSPAEINKKHEKFFISFSLSINFISYSRGKENMNCSGSTPILFVALSSSALVTSMSSYWC